MQDTVKAKRANKFLEKALEELKSIETTNLKIDKLATDMYKKTKYINSELDSLGL